MARLILAQIEAAVLAAKPRFRFDPPATDAELAALREALGADLPDEVTTWFSWHAGSQDGFLPPSSVHMIDVQSACRAIRLFKEDTDLPRCCPLLEDGGGGVWLYVDGETWAWDRGDIHWKKPYVRWLDELLERWKAERHTLRVEFLRAGRSVMGWDQVEMPTRAKKRLIAWLRKPDDPLTVRYDVRTALVLQIGETDAWNGSGTGVDVVLTQETSSDMAAKLARSDYARVGNLDAKLSFSDM